MKKNEIKKSKNDEIHKIKLMIFSNMLCIYVEVNAQKQAKPIDYFR